MNPLIDAIQKLGRSLSHDVTGGSRACGVPAADIIKHLERICPVLGMASPGAAQVITLTDRPVPCQLINMESVLMICLVCLGREASHFCVMQSLDTIHYSATPLSMSPGDTVFLPVEKHWMLPKLCPGINFFAVIPLSNSQNAPFVPDDSCWISKHLHPSSVTWSDLQHGDTVQMYDGLRIASVLLHTQLLWRPTVRCPGLSRKGQPLFPGTQAQTGGCPNGLTTSSRGKHMTFLKNDPRPCATPKQVFLHLRQLFRAATDEFLAQTLCGCPSHPWVSSTKISIKPEAPRRSSHFPPFRACCLLLAATAKPGSLPQPTGPRYGGLGVRLGNFVGCKPQKVGDCGWITCPQNRALSHVAKDMAYSWFVALSIWGFWGPFWAVSGTYGGVKGPQRAR